MLKCFLRCLFVIAFSFIVASCSKPLVKLKLLKQDAVIVAFGDSLTEGVGASTDASYPAVLKKLIHHDVINAGVSGEETAEGLKRLPDTLAQFKPDLVILCEGGNDMLHKKSAAEITHNLRSMITILKTNNIDTVLIGEPQPSITLAMPAFYQIIAEDMQVPYDNKLLHTLLSNNQYKSDPIHLNAQGYQKMAEGIATLLKRCGAILREK